jgi:hypothetical protein
MMDDHRGGDSALWGIWIQLDPDFVLSAHCDSAGVVYYLSGNGGDGFLREGKLLKKRYGSMARIETRTVRHFSHLRNPISLRRKIAANFRFPDGT